MKTLITAALLLATPAYASPRHPTDAQRKIAEAYGHAYIKCLYYEDDDNLELKEACAMAGKLKKKLQAQGFCVYGRGAVGRDGKNGHCYTITD